MINNSETCTSSMSTIHGADDGTANIPIEFVKEVAYLIDLFQQDDRLPAFSSSQSPNLADSKHKKV